MPLITAIRMPMTIRPRVKPARGEVTMGRTTFQKMPWLLVQSSAARDQISTSKLLSAADSAAPIRPPIRAWLDEDGRPNHQVIRFQMTPPDSAQMITCELTTSTSASIRPEELILATAEPQRAPTRFMKAARATACIGVSTLVATTVAMELAVSWKPLMYSNTRATSTTTSTSSRAVLMGSGVLEDDVVDHVAGIAAAVDGLLEDLEQVLEDQVAHRVLFLGVGVPVQLQDQPVGLGLDGLQLVVELAGGVQVHALAQQRNHLLQHHAGALEHGGAGDEVHVGGPGRGKGVALGELLDHLRDLVQGVGQRLDVLALQRGHEGVDQLLVDLGEQVLLPLPGLLEALQGTLGRRRAQELAEGAGALAGSGGAVLEQSVELVALSEDGLQGKHGRVLAGPGPGPGGGKWRVCYNAGARPVASSGPAGPCGIVPAPFSLSRGPPAGPVRRP